MKFSPPLALGLAVATVANGAVRAADPPRVPQQDLAVLLVRPLFAPSRRPDPDAEGTAPSVKATAMPRLTGILLHGADRRAIFVVPGEPDHTETVREGGTVGAYRVQTIGLAAVTLTGADGVVTAAPHYASGLAAFPPPPVPLPMFGTQLPAPKPGPERFDAPVGPMGLAMYRFSPAAPRTPPPVPEALTAPGE